MMTERDMRWGGGEMRLDGTGIVRWTKSTDKPISIRNLLQVTDIDSRVNVMPTFIQSKTQEENH